MFNTENLSFGAKILLSVVKEQFLATGKNGITANSTLQNLAFLEELAAEQFIVFEQFGSISARVVLSQEYLQTLNQV